MKLLPARSGDFRLVITRLSYAHLWHRLTYTRLLHYRLACMPFKLNGEWTAVLAQDSPE